MDQNVLVTLRSRIDQHLKFFDSLERIRWQFTTAFGAGAGASMFFAFDDNAPLIKRGVALLLVFSFSAAGLVAHIRIFALASVLWERMLVLQSKEFEMLRRESEIEITDLKKALSFPRLGVLDNGLLRMLTVGMVSCFLFSLLIGVAVALAFHAFWYSRVISAALGLTTTLLLVVISLVGGKRYAVALES